MFADENEWDHPARAGREPRLQAVEHQVGRFQRLCEERQSNGLRRIGRLASATGG